MNKKIVITGIGLISPFGIGKEKFWENIIQGKHCFRKITKFDTAKYKSKMAGEILDFKIRDYVKETKFCRIPRVSQYALASVSILMKDAGIDLKKDNLSRVGVFFGTCNGPIYSTERITHTIATKGSQYVDPLLFQESVFNAPASNISIYFKITGPCITVPAGPASGIVCINLALDYLKRGIIDCAVVGASDECHFMLYKALTELKVISPNDGGEENCRPFDKLRNGLIMSEGSAFLFLEIEKHALSRKAQIYGEIIAGAVASDAYKVADNNPDGTGVKISINKCLKSANISSTEIDYIVAMAAGTRNWDKAETAGIKAALTNYAYQVPISSIKSCLGETFGPGGVFNVIAGILAIRDNIMPPTINYKDKDPACDLDYVPNTAREKRINLVLADAFSWGGIYGSLLIRGYKK